MRGASGVVLCLLLGASAASAQGVAGRWDAALIRRSELTLDSKGEIHAMILKAEPFRVVRRARHEPPREHVLGVIGELPAQAIDADLPFLAIGVSLEELHAQRIGRVGRRGRNVDSPIRPSP